MGGWMGVCVSLKVGQDLIIIIDLNVPTDFANNEFREFGLCIVSCDTKQF